MNKQKRIYIYSTQELLMVLEAWHINADLSREIATYVSPYGRYGNRHSTRLSCAGWGRACGSALYSHP